MVGTSEGRLVGESVGWLVGSPVGLSDGLYEGEREGDVVGAFVGASEGLDVVGTFVVGSGEGPGDGALVGELVVGEAVVGESVGGRGVGGFVARMWHFRALQTQYDLDPQAFLVLFFVQAFTTGPEPEPPGRGAGRGAGRGEGRRRRRRRRRLAASTRFAPKRSANRNAKTAMRLKFMIDDFSTRSFGPKALRISRSFRFFRSGGRGRPGSVRMSAPPRPGCSTERKLSFPCPDSFFYTWIGSRLVSNRDLVSNLLCT